MLSVEGNDELKAVALGMKVIERDVKNAVNRATRAELKPIWNAELNASLAGTNTFTSRLLKGDRVSPGNPPTVYAATSKRGVGKSKRLNPAEHYYLAEFGARDSLYRKYQRRSENGGSHSVERRTNTGLPLAYRKGRVVYPAAAQAIPRLASLWVQVFVRTVYEAAEGKAG
ncbi:hypothetical protein [Promicromonospora kroppenstedtii]|uniref:hypothetical protein n=1 Tax=Promicromonospora kroppenstedtii TaxID=440482 RepID=UPI0012FCEF37|nr:hypothetical protein [Promicromonospora kroppenstedtii]